MTEMNHTPEKCPQCGNATVLPIVYGMPGPELWEEAQQGKVLLGGCCIGPFEPDHQCTECGWINIDSAEALRPRSGHRRASGRRTPRTTE